MNTIKAGFQFRDESGSVVATLLSDLSPGQEVMASHFKMADDSEPKASDPIDRVIVRELLVASGWHR